MAAVGRFRSCRVSSSGFPVMFAVSVLLPVLALAAQAPQQVDEIRALARTGPDSVLVERALQRANDAREALRQLLDRKSTRLNSSHLVISYAVFCLKKKKMSLTG